MINSFCFVKGVSSLWSNVVCRDPGPTSIWSRNRWNELVDIGFAYICMNARWILYFTFYGVLLVWDQISSPFFSFGDNCEVSRFSRYCPLFWPLGFVLSCVFSLVCRGFVYLSCHRNPKLVHYVSISLEKSCYCRRIAIQVPTWRTTEDTGFRFCLLSSIRRKHRSKRFSIVQIASSTPSHCSCQKVFIVVLATCRAVDYKPTRTANSRSTNIKTDLSSIPRCMQASRMPTYWKSNHCTEKAKTRDGAMIGYLDRVCRVEEERKRTRNQKRERRKSEIYEVTQKQDICLGRIRQYYTSTQRCKTQARYASKRPI